MILIGTIDEFSTREIPRCKVRLKTARHWSPSR